MELRDKEKISKCNEAGVGFLQEGTAQCVWKEKKALVCQQGRKYNSCNVLCTVLSVHFPNSVICDVFKCLEKGLCLIWVDLQCENWILNYSETSRMCLSLSVQPVCSWVNLWTGEKERPHLLGLCCWFLFGVRVVSILCISQVQIAKFSSFIQTRGFWLNSALHFLPLYL